MADPPELQCVSDVLVRMCRTCPEDLTEQVQSNLDHQLNTFKESSKSSTANETMLVRLQKCCFETKQWYYKILEGLLHEEAQKPGFNNVTMQNFLRNKQHQSCLLLLCLEISSFTNELALDFDPQLLQIFSLVPYVFWKVFSPVFSWLFNRDDLTLDVIDHLVKVEEMIIDRLVWSSGSAVWEEIRANEGQMPECQQVMSPKELEDPTRREPCSLGPLQEDPPSEQQNSTSEQPQRNKPLYRFARKAYRLMHMRLTTLCFSLNLPEDLRMKIWTCFEFSLVHHFDMLRDRQLYWLLLCAIYALTKDIRKLPFRQIFDLYRSKQVSRRVPILMHGPEESPSEDYPWARFPTPTTPSVQDQEVEAISCFYSQVYTPRMGHFVNKFTPAPGGETPVLSPYPTPPPAPPRKTRWRPDFNIFVSRIQETPLQQQSRGLDYFTQSSPSQRLHDINAMVRSFRSQSKRKLSFDRAEEAGPSEKRPQMGFSLTRRLEELELDRRHNREGAGLASKHFYI